MTERYKVEDYNQRGGLAPEGGVIDTLDDSVQICECPNLKDAELIAAALNAYRPSPASNSISTP